MSNSKKLAAISYNTCFSKKGKNGKHDYNIENLNIKTTLDCMVFTSPLSISSNSFTNDPPQYVTTTS